MPRQLPFSGLTTFTSEATRATLGVATFLLLCALTLMSCVSHGRWRWQWRHRRSSDPVISIHQIQPGADGSDACIWHKSILMGERCQLPDFTGVIAYDSDGNLIALDRPRVAPAPK